MSAIAGQAVNQVGGSKMSFTRHCEGVINDLRNRYFRLVSHSEDLFQKIEKLSKSRSKPREAAHTRAE